MGLTDEVRECMVAEAGAGLDLTTLVQADPEAAASSALGHRALPSSEPETGLGRRQDDSSAILSAAEAMAASTFGSKK